MEVRSPSPKRFKCERCGASFEDSAHLRRHLARKRPCDLIVEVEEVHPEKQEKSFSCRFCSRSYTRPDSVKRHLQSCSVANSETGMNQLMEHTLKKQTKALVEQQDQIRRLTDMVEKLTVSVGPSIGTLNTGPVTLTQMNFEIKSFDSSSRICVPASLVKAAFTENPRLIEYCRMSDDDRTNVEKAAPYVLEALVDLVRRVHRDPVYRNVHLNPSRADQVMVCVGEKQRWEVRPLADVIRLLFDGVANDLHQMIVSSQGRSQLPLDVQSAASWVPNLYESEPERYVRDGRAPMAAHLRNTRPLAERP